MIENIVKIAQKAGIDEKYLECYGRDKAKIDSSIMESLKDKRNGKLILVTAITPTKVGEGKTTMSIALADGMSKINKKCLLCLREPSMGPVFGLKGGATGGGKASIEPSEDINLHFTGDMHALTSSINLISAIIDNHIYQGNELNIDPDKIVWKRALDINDRSLREVEVGLGKRNGTPHKDNFVITVASELMAILCLANDENDFKNRINNIIVAYTYANEPIRLKEFHITNAIMKLMKRALNVNLVQTLENNPVFVHGGPFANIAHGCNSIIALKLASKLSDYIITEAGFGADLGAEKFMDITMRNANLAPSCVVMVASIRALKLHGGVSFEELDKSNPVAVKKGILNLKVHLENMAKFSVPVIVAINHFESDSDEEIEVLSNWCQENQYKYSFVDSYLKGGDGAIDLASKVVNLISLNTSNYHPLYDLNLSIKDKIEIISREIYRAKDVEYSPLALSQIEEFSKLGYDKCPICMAKTPLSLSDNAKLFGVPKDFSIHVKSLNLSSGANFLVVLTGNIITMPGLPKVPAATKMEEE